jgi:hypothetical protein
MVSNNPRKVVRDGLVGDIRLAFGQIVGQSENARPKVLALGPPNAIPTDDPTGTLLA